ncbi:RNA polymerase sigma factor [Cellulomonas dongxiuzhuiae]|uniref:RNA polymerase sigma factor n=1 Tax=Cellulomonas dongxiuzhuiae TaxID=2819979 RepID=UPI001AAE41C3|nr:sigma-70 family RNA polymerase sigma factor [Cellulomonas dongxiuzhuiae]MBO3088444.1 sigma-70 family RNA polymerase sigma factor [Cellulomonas dongxiuzhuiae]
MSSREQLGRPYGERTATQLVAGALTGDEGSWSEIVGRHTNLVMSRVRQFRLTPQQAEDVAQTVWLNLLEHLGDLREPEALPGWISTATRHECIRMSNLARRSIPVDPTTGRLDAQDDAELDDELLRGERHAALRAALAELPAHQRDLLLLLSTDPAPSYQEVSARLGIPVGSIGPTRQRGLARLRQTEAIRTYLATPSGAVLGEGGHDVLALG